MNFCTLFDHNYLSRGLVLYESLKNHCKTPFKLFILATDEIAYNWLSEQKYPDVTVCSVQDLIENYPVLSRLKKERSIREFNWTLSSFSIQFFLKKFNLDSVTYLDSDLCFYSDPNVLFDELNDESVIITPHNYTPEYDQSALSGRYCVQFMYFKNNEDGNKVLEWWRNACEECCSGVPIDGKFGDQKYLDDWLSRFPGIVHEEKHLGCGIAPWNVQQFDLLNESGEVWVCNKITKLRAKLVFFHFHGVREYHDKKGKSFWDLNEVYELKEVNSFYYDYIKKLKKNTFVESNISNLPLKKYSALKIPHMILKMIKNLLSSFNFKKYYQMVAIENLVRDEDIK